MYLPTRFHWWWPRLESHGVACHCSKVVIIQPADRRLVVLHPDGLAVFLRAILPLFGRGVVVPSHVPGSYDQNVACAWRGALPFEASFDLGDGNLVARDCRGWVAVFLLVLGIIASQLHQYLD